MPLQELAEGSRCAGLNSVLRNIAADRVCKVFIADNIEDRVKKQIYTALDEKKIPVETAEDSQQLGRACALSRKTAVAAILKN